MLSHPGLRSVEWCAEAMEWERVPLQRAEVKPISMGGGTKQVV